MQPDQKYAVIQVTKNSVIFLGIAIGSVLKTRFMGAYVNDDKSSFNLNFKMFGGCLHAVPCDGKPLDWIDR